MAVRPKKYFGQHFLTDHSHAARIASCLDLHPVKEVLEIGSGKGMLTEHLLKLPGIRLRAIEIDGESVAHLRKHFPGLDVTEGDFLEADHAKIFEGKQFNVTGNFPYNISSQIVFTVLAQRAFIPSLVGMFQREVARRICSPPGNKEYGILSVLTQAVYQTEYLFTLNEGVFFPKPRVKSGVIRLTRKADQMPEEQFNKLKSFVKSAFGQRRKQLRNSVASFLPPGFESEVLSKRPEQLHFSEFLNLISDITGRGLSEAP